MRLRKRLRRILRRTPAQPRCDDAAALAALRANLAQPGAALVSLLHCFRVYRHFAAAAGVPRDGRRMLEIGAAPEPALALIHLLDGASHYVANNVLPLARSLDRASIELLLTVAAAGDRLDPARLDACVRFEGERAALREDRFALAAPLPAEELSLPDASVDVVVSDSVLEHVRRPEAVLRTSFRVLRPGGFALHGIDLRDHADFAHPLGFLREPEADYLARTGAPENRLRASDWLRLFAEVGFEIVSARFADRAFPLDAAGATDIGALATTPVDALFARRTLSEVEPWVDAETRAAFAAPFRDRDLADLSVLVMHVVCRRPPGA